MRKRMPLFIGLGLLLIGVAAWWTLNNMDRLMFGVIDSQIAASIEAQNISPTRFEVVFCGTGSPQFHIDRAQPCTAVIAGGRLFLFDSGQGSIGQLNKFQVPTRLLDTVFVTHLHSDHMSGLGETLHNGWLYGRQHLVEVVGPPGTKKMLGGFQQAYADDIHERQRVVGKEYLDTQSGMGSAREVTIDDNALHLVYDKHAVQISAFRVEHPEWSHAYGYRISFAGKSIVISGDTSYSENLIRHAKSSDILIHEAVNIEMMGLIQEVLQKRDTGINPDRMARIAQVHTPTVDVAQAANNAGVSKLVLTHLIPPVPANALIENYFIEGMQDKFDGDLVVARDGMRITLID